MKNIKRFSHFVIIYNPNSTGDAPEITKNVSKYLEQKVSTDKIIILPTQYAGHAIDLAQKVASSYPRPLIISISGDGGYNEVVNGVLRADNGAGAGSPTVTVIGAGNANDHYRVIHEDRSIAQMLDRELRTIDLLKVTKSTKDNKKDIYYAHSYVGVGITPRVAEELNRHKLNPIKEARIIIRAMTSIRPTLIRHDGKDKSIDSLVFANISQMAKVLTLADNNSLHDGQFEMVEIPHTSVFGLLKTLIIAATVGLGSQPKQSMYTFEVREDLPLQIDGELLYCKKGDEIIISVEKSAVATL